MLSIPEHIVIKKALTSPMLCIVITSYFAKQTMKTKLKILRYLTADVSMVIKMILFDGLKYFDLRLSKDGHSEDADYDMLKSG